jgi:hypothetical protein
MTNSPTTTPDNMRWAYSTPDNYLGGVEGASLSGAGSWAAMSSRNQGILGCGGGGGGGIRHLGRGLNK